MGLKAKFNLVMLVAFLGGLDRSPLACPGALRMKTRAARSSRKPTS